MAIQRLRGLESQKPTLLPGEVFVAEDTEKLFVGTTSGQDIIIEKSNLFYLKTEIDALLAGKTTEAYVNQQIANLVASSPATLDTLNELAAALGDDPNFATTITTLIGTKVPQTRTINSKPLGADITLTKSDVGLGNVDNTSDICKPISTAQQAALDVKVATSDSRLSDQRTPIDNSVTFLKLLSKLRSWLTANGYANDTDLLAPHNWLPNNWAVLDANNNYHQMVEIPRKNWDATNGFSSATIHPAFTVNDVQKRLLIGKYQASDDGSGRPVTRCNKIPLVNKTFDQELALCSGLNNGVTITGFHQMTNVEWALLAQISKNLGLAIYGNNNWGQDVDSKDVTFRLSVPAAFTDHTSDGKSFAGSGGYKTSHNNQPDGIFDLNGNIWERVAGMKTVNGEIQIFGNNDAADYTKGQSAVSSLYKAILEDGTLVSPSTADTLKIATNGNISKIAGAGSSSKAFESISCESDVSSTSAGIALLKKLLLYPHVSGLNSDYFWFNLSGEYVPLRGGNWADGAVAGLFALALHSTRSLALWNVGFRVAFVL